MYQNWFGLTEDLFNQKRNSSLFSFYYQENAAGIAAILRREGIVWVYGEPGVGKRALLTACHRLLSKSYFLAASALLTPEETARRWGGTNLSAAEIASIMLVAQPTGTHIIIVVDKAQYLSSRMMRWLLFLQSEIHQQGGTLALLLSGDSASCPCVDLDRQISLRWQLTGVTRKQCQESLLKEAETCGSQYPLFTQRAINRLWQAGKGKPQRIAMLAECALMSAALRRKRCVGSWDSWRAARDLCGISPYYFLRRVVLLVVLALAGAATWHSTPLLLDAYPKLRFMTHPKTPQPEDETTQLMSVLDNEVTGMTQYFAIWGYKISSSQATCDNAVRANLRCEPVKANLDTLTETGLPWMATLRIGPRVGYASVVRVGKNDVDILTGAKTWTVTREWLAEHWQGESLQFRLTPPSAGKRVGSGSSSEDKVWLNQMLDKAMKGQNTSNITAAVAAFQRSAGLTADGVAGNKTLVKLAQQVGNVPTLAVTAKE